MILHETPDVFLELIQATAEHKAIPAVFVEKDYWVTKALQRIGESKFADHIVFKGGTSLSKGHRIIKRFSEDIDLAAKCNDLSDSRTRTLIKGAETVACQDFDYQKAHPMESKGSRFRKTVHAYPAITGSHAFGQIADTILLEINAFTDPEPADSIPISSLIHDLLLEMSRDDLVVQFKLRSFPLEVLSVERTLCEKVMGLVRASYEQDPIPELRRRIRHFYDIAMILRQPAYQSFASSDKFAPLIQQVMASDRRSMPGAERWLSDAPADALIFADTESSWKSIRDEFRGNFRDLLYDEDLPSDDEMLHVLVQLRSSLVSVR